MKKQFYQLDQLRLGMRRPYLALNSKKYKPGMSRIDFWVTGQIEFREDKEYLKKVDHMQKEYEKVCGKRRDQVMIYSIKREKDQTKCFQELKSLIETTGVVKKSQGMSTDYPQISEQMAVYLASKYDTFHVLESLPMKVERVVEDGEEEQRYLYPNQRFCRGLALQVNEYLRDNYGLDYDSAYVEYANRNLEGGLKLK